LTPERGTELPVVAALKKLSIFGPDQNGAYREHFAEIAAVLGRDVPTRLTETTRQWAESGESGVRILTGNAGTGKTAAAEAFCRGCQATLPITDEITEISPGRWVAKDLSGMPSNKERERALRQAIQHASDGAQALICANEGILRDLIEGFGNETPELETLLDLSLRQGAAESGGVLIINVNRQRPTSDEMWNRLLDYLTREELWEPGCDGCPKDDGSGAGCPFRDNAQALRDGDTRDALRLLCQFGSGDAVPTLREVLAILAHGLTGGSSCQEVKRLVRERGREALTAEVAYFAQALGGSLRSEILERSPLMIGIRESRLGRVADLQVDEWLRDCSSAPREVQQLAGVAGDDADPRDRLAGTRTPLDRVSTGATSMTFSALGETISTSEDSQQVEDCLNALTGSAGTPAVQLLWRQRLFFEGQASLGGLAATSSRLLDSHYIHDFISLGRMVAAGTWAREQLSEVVLGLNFLVCGFSSSAEGLIVPDQSCLFARDPGSFRPARPSLVHAQVELEHLSLTSPDHGLVEDLVDVDYLDVDLIAFGDADLSLRIRPRLYEAIREAAAYQGPVGQGIAEMTDVRGFFGRLATREAGQRVALRVADPQSTPPASIALRLPERQR
jgi:hypothetical protein